MHPSEAYSRQKERVDSRLIAFRDNRDNTRAAAEGYVWKLGGEDLDIPAEECLPKWGGDKARRQTQALPLISDSPFSSTQTSVPPSSCLSRRHLAQGEETLMRVLGLYCHLAEFPFRPRPTGDGQIP